MGSSKCQSESGGKGSDVINYRLTLISCIEVLAVPARSFGGSPVGFRRPLPTLYYTLKRRTSEFVLGRSQLDNV